MRLWPLSLYAVVLTGCGASSGDEAKAAAELAPKPPTPAQQAQMDRIKTKFPGGAPGRGPGH